ncbi:MAG: hypothetical protein KJ630_05805 [Proteobacteria bacterium]|nr:hypothetical protein [Pseudomonadota bacterium]
MTANGLSSTPLSPGIPMSRGKSALISWSIRRGWQMLAWLFTDPEKLKPEKSTAAITREASGSFADLAQKMRERGGDGQQVAHFLVQCLFCMFAEDEDLLPGRVFTTILGNTGGDAGKAAGCCLAANHS